jgi:hypothetical protein
MSTGADMTWLLAELLTGPETGNTLAAANSSNATKKTSFLFTDEPLLKPTVRGCQVSRDLK